jgi:hypothetical protein
MGTAWAFDKSVKQADKPDSVQRRLPKKPPP